MQSIENNALTTEELSRLGNNVMRFFNFLEAIQSDVTKIPFIFDQSDVVGGNFPLLPESKKAWLYLDTGTYEAVVIGGNDKWRRLYDGTTYDPATPTP